MSYTSIELSPAEKVQLRLLIAKLRLKRLGRESIPHFLARHLPGRVLYWAVVVAAVRAMGNDKGPDQVSVLDLLNAVDPWTGRERGGSSAS